MTTLDALPPPLRTLLQRLEINRAVWFLLLSRGWQFLSAFFTVILISSCLTEATQGIYQVFISLVAMQMFVTLGLPGIVSLMTSHEWARLGFDAEGRIVGDGLALQRLASLSRWVSVWFGISATLFFLGLSLHGYQVLAREPAQTGWLFPWMALVLINAVALPYTPRLSMLEGCHQVDTINYFRLFQAITGTLVVWGVLSLGGGLWALPASSAVRLGWEFYLVEIRYRSAFSSLRAISILPGNSCVPEVWPLAWRLAIQTIGSYFSTYYFTLVVFKYQGDIEAGRFGMTWGILMTMQGAAQSWIDTRMPEFGAMVARGEHQYLKRRMIRTGVISLAVFLVGAGVFWCGLQGLRLAGIRHAARFLDPRTTGVLILGLGLLLATNIFQISVRLYKRDPFLIPNSITSMAIAILAWEAGRRSGSLAVATAYFSAIGGFALPISVGLAWMNQRRASQMAIPATNAHSE